MKDRRSGAGFPFSIGCMSQSAVAIADPLDKKPPLAQLADNSSSTTTTATTQGKHFLVTTHNSYHIHHRCHSPQDVLTQAKHPSAVHYFRERRRRRKQRGEGQGRGGVRVSGTVSAGAQRLLKGIKTFFAAYDGEEEEDDEDREIVIGYPTDVQHVGHIGWDGLNKVGGMGVGVGMVGAFPLPSSLSIRQLEIAMDPGAAAATTCIN